MDPVIVPPNVVLPPHASDPDLTPSLVLKGMGTVVRAYSGETPRDPVRDQYPEVARLGMRRVNGVAPKPEDTLDFTNFDHLYFLMEGEGTLHVKEAAYTLQPRTAAFVPAGINHYVQACGSGYVSGLSLLVHKPFDFPHRAQRTLATVVSEEQAHARPDSNPSEVHYLDVPTTGTLVFTIKTTSNGGVTHQNTHMLGYVLDGIGSIYLSSQPTPLGLRDPVSELQQGSVFFIPKNTPYRFEAPADAPLRMGLVMLHPSLF